MKGNLKAILLTLKVLILFMCGTAIVQFFNAYKLMAVPEEAETMAREQFTGMHGFADQPLTLAIFYALYGLLLGYLVYVLLQLRRSFIRLNNDEVFYENQPSEFKKASSGIIIFAKTKYLLFIFVGVFWFNNPRIIFAEIPMLLISYLSGKIIYVFHYLTQKGALLKEETDLTI